MGVYGPSGGWGGQFDVNPQVNGAVVEILVESFTYVSGIALNNQEDKDKANDKYSALLGTPPNRKTAAIISLQTGEFITGIEGKCGQYVDSILIVTNLRTCGPYGGQGGVTPYAYIVDPGEEIFGLIGRTGALIDAIGVWTRQRKKAT